MLAALIDGHERRRRDRRRRRRGRRPPTRRQRRRARTGTRNGANMSTALSIMELCWGDVGLLLSMPRQGLGNSAIASVADDEQLERFGGRWAAMAITEPEAGSDSAAIRTTAVLDGDEYVLNGEKIYVTAGERADLVVVWATLDRSQGRAAIKSFVVERSNPGMKLIRVEDKLGIRASDTAAFSLEDCRVPKDDLLGSPEIDAKRASPASCRRSTTRGRWSPRWRSASRARCLEHTRDALAEAGVEVDPRRARRRAAGGGGRAARHGGRLRGRAPADAAGGWMADNGKPNSLQASMAKAKAGRTGIDVACAASSSAAPTGYGETRAAREVGARREDPRHLRGHAADPAADHRPPAAEEDLGGAEVMNITGTDFVLIHSQDLDRTERFYGDVLELELGPRWGDIGFEIETGDTTLALHRRDEDGPRVRPRRTTAIVLQRRRRAGGQERARGPRRRVQDRRSSTAATVTRRTSPIPTATPSGSTTSTATAKRSPTRAAPG